MQYGEVRRVVTFNLSKDEDRELYEFSKGVKFGPLVKQYLRAELRRKRSAQLSSTSASSAIQVRMGGDTDA